MIASFERLAFALSILLWSLPVHAQVSAQNRAAAEALFRDAGRAYKAGNYEQACKKLAKSQSLDPAVGTQLNLARCYEKLGRTASAWLAYEDAAAAARREGQPSRQAAAREAAERLAPQLARLTVEVAPNAQLERMRIERNGSEVARQAWNTAVPIDPGTYLIEVTSPQHRGWRLEVAVAAGQQLAIQVPVLEALPASTVDDASRPPLEPAPLSEEGSLRGARWSGQRIASAASAGVGVLSFGAAVLMGLSARSDKSRIGDRCDGEFCSDPQATSLNESALSKANWTSVLMGVGTLAVASGAVLWLTAEDVGSEVQVALAPQLYPGGGGLALHLPWGGSL